MRLVIALFPVLLVIAVAPRAAAGNGNSLLSLSHDGKTLLAANPDGGTVSVVDVAARKLVREIPVGKQPESVAFLGSSSRAAVTLYAEDKVALVDTTAGKVEKTIATPTEPYAAIATRDGSRIYVACEYPGVVVEIDAAKGEILRKLVATPFVRGLALAADEKRLLAVGYYTGDVVAIDLASGATVDRWKPASFADNLARNIAVHPELPLAYLPHLRSRVERAHGAGSIFPYLTVLDLVPEKQKPGRRHPIALDQYNGVRVTANPWETAVSPDGKFNVTIFAGTNDLYVSKIENDDYSYIQLAGPLVRAGNNPRAVTFAADGKTFFVYNALDFAVAEYRTQPVEKLGEVVVSKAPYSEEFLRGKRLFNLAANPMTRLRWISCSSCHPDGDHDGRTWQNPEGLRRTTHFFGMKRTYPIHWSADRDEVQDFEYTIRGKLMQGSGLIRGAMAPELGEEKNAGRSRDLDALAAYCNRFEHKLSPHAAGPGVLTPAAERGRKLFFAEATGCATCHSGSDYTDGKTHDVGTGLADKSEKMGPNYDTPTLLRTYRNLEWLHHGKAKSLKQVITDNPGDKHGKSSHLKATEVDDLVEFLKSLPYEPLPADK